MSLPGLVALARHPDDADPQRRWMWEGLVAAWVPELDPSIVVGGNLGPRAAILSNPASGGPFAGRWPNASSTGYVSALITAAETTEAWKNSTLLVDFHWRSGAASGMFFSSLVRSSGSESGNRLLLYADSSNVWAAAEGNYEQLTTGASAPGQPRRVIGVTRSDFASGGGRAANVGGVESTPGTMYGGGASESVYQWYCGRSSGATWDGTIFGSFAWAKQMNARELAAICADPIAPFRWRRRRTYFVPSGGVTHELAGSATLALTSSGALTVTAAVAGEASLAVTASGALTVERMLAGDAGVALTTSGALTAERLLAGDASLAVTASGALTAERTLAGSATLALTSSADLAVTHELAGAASVALTASGTLDTTGTAELAGAASFALTASADLAVTHELAGSATLALTTAGTLELTGTAELAGSADIALTTGGALTVARPLAGDASLALTASGTLTVERGLAGSATLAVTASGQMVGLYAMQGAASLAVLAVGTLSLVGATSTAYTILSRSGPRYDIAARSGTRYDITRRGEP